MANLYQSGVKESNGDVISGSSRPLAAEITFRQLQLEEIRLYRRNGTR
jgi:hypothetical protein